MGLVGMVLHRVSVGWRLIKEQYAKVSYTHSAYSNQGAVCGW